MTLLLTGCADFWSTSYSKTASLPGDQMVLTTADLRAIHRIDGTRDIPIIKRNEDGTPVRITSGGETRAVFDIQSVPFTYTCAEPSPDVAKLVDAASTINGSASASNGKGLDAQGSLQLALARNETMAQLTRRIATIQLLRDGLYRACEAYANRAIGKQLYTAIVSRYDKMMITMLLAEMAAGNFGASATTVTVGAPAGAGADGAAVTAAVQKRDAAQAALFAAAAAPTPALVQALQDAQQALDAARVAATKAPVAGAVGGPKPAPASPQAEVADILYKMQVAYLTDPEYDTFTQICFHEMGDFTAAASDLGQSCRDLLAKIVTASSVAAESKQQMDALRVIEGQPLAAH